MQSTPALGQPGTSAKRSAPVEAAHQVLLADGVLFTFVAAFRVTIIIQERPMTSLNPSITPAPSSLRPCVSAS
jgi:hypothetical protein